MKNTLDGFNFDVPATESQINALAQFHHKQLYDAVFHQEMHLGNLGIAQRKRLYNYTQNLLPMQKVAFERQYDQKMRELNDKSLHADEHDSSSSMWLAVIAIILLALILYFTVIQRVIH